MLNIDAGRFIYEKHEFSEKQMKIFSIYANAILSNKNTMVHKYEVNIVM